MARELITCEDSDPQCPHCSGKCTREITMRLFRIDMADETGTTMCDLCGGDAFESGVFGVGVEEFDSVEG